jgi:polysaccharide deacetylase 2 family uncharacterized protein YibQ
LIRNTKFETGNSKLETRNSNLDIRKSHSSPRASNFEFRFSTFQFRVSSFLLFLLLLILAANACNRSHPQPAREADRRELAGRFKNAVMDAGGAQIWIKHPTAIHLGKSPAGMSLQVLATPEAYRAVQTAVHLEADKDKLELGFSVIALGGGRQLNILNITQHGQRVIQIQLREVDRLLRAAIVIDDMGRDLEAAHKLLALGYPLTFSVLPHLRYAQATAQEAHRRGHEVMLHLPMEPEPSAHASPGEGAILVGMNAAEVERVVQNDLASVPFVMGVNNHMGSRATKDAALMADVMKVLADHRLYFIDSRTTAASTALEAARRQSLPAFYRAVFLDNTETVPYTLGQLREFRQTVEREGVALAIGHPHATTIAALAKFLPELERADIELVAPSQIVRLPEIARLHPPTLGVR